MRLRVLTCGIDAADASFIDGYLLRICFAASPVLGLGYGLGYRLG